MKTVKEYTVQLSIYHGEIVGRIIYDGVESSLYALSEINNIIEIWKMGARLEVIGINDLLDKNAKCTFQAVYNE